MNSALRNALIPDNVEIETDFAENLPYVLCNPKELFESFRCIVENSFQAMANNQSGKLTIRTSVNTIQEKKWIDIKIIDTGQGIAPEILPKVFELGFTTKDNGMGYGLWRAHAVIEKIGGAISVASIVNEGTTFDIKLPVWKEKFAMTRQFSVLVIDDQVGWYEAITPILEEMDCVVRHVNNARTAFLEIQDHEYSLVILDLRLTEDKEYDVQGLDILEKLSKREKTPPVIIWTGHATPALRQKAEWYGAFAFLEKIGDEKSFDRDLFVKTVKKALSNEPD